MRKYFVGLDVHMIHANACILDARGKKVKRLTIRCPWPGIADELAKLRGRLFVCYEASCGYGYGPLQKHCNTNPKRERGRGPQNSGDSCPSLALRVSICQ